MSLEITFGFVFGFMIGFVIAGFIFTTGLPKQIDNTDCYFYQQQVLCVEK